MRNLYNTFLLILVTLQLYGSGSNIVIDAEHIIPIGNQIQYFQDTSNQLTVQEILNGKYNDRFHSLKQSINTFPHITSPIYFKFTIINQLNDKLFLEIGEPSVNNIELFKVYDDTVVFNKKSGYFMPFNTREISTNNYLVDLELPEHSSSTYLLKISMKFKETITVPLSVGTLKSFFERNHHYDMFSGVFYGAILLVSCFNLIIFFTVWDRSYIYFVLHTIFAALWVANYYGHAFEFLWGSTPYMNNFTPAITSLSCIFVILFSRIFLKAGEYGPKLEFGINLLLAAFSLAILLNIFNSYFYSLMIVEAGAGLMCIYLMSIAIFVILKGYSPARFYVLALFSFFAGIIIFLMQINGSLPANFITRNSVPIGLCMELALISFAQGHRMRFYRQEKKLAQMSLIESFQENEKLLVEQKNLLEIKIAQQNVIETMRSRISEDIHDDLSSGLTKISWLGEGLKSKIDNTAFPDVVTSIDKIINYTRETIIKLGEIIWAVNPAHDNLNSLLSYMRHYISSYLDDSEFEYQIDFPVNLSDRIISPEFKRNLFLILKESINNSVKYSGGSMILVTFKLENNHYLFIIADNGNGFEVSDIKAESNGLLNMKKRIRKIHGTLEVESRKGEGCKLIMRGLLN